MGVSNFGAVAVSGENADRTICVSTEESMNFGRGHFILAILSVKRVSLVIGLIIFCRNVFVNTFRLRISQESFANFRSLLKFTGARMREKAYF